MLFVFMLLVIMLENVWCNVIVSFSGFCWWCKVSCDMEVCVGINGCWNDVFILSD